MANTPQDVRLFFMNGSDSAQEGPRIDLEDRESGTRAAVRRRHQCASDAQIYVAFDQTFRIELVSTSPDGFTYRTPTEQRTVTEGPLRQRSNRSTDRRRNRLEFRDGAGVVEAFSSMRLAFPATPDCTFDDWEITSGQISGKGYLIPNHTDFGAPDSPNFFELGITEQDQDGDSIPDWEELALAANYPLLFFDPETTDGTPDASHLQAQ